MCQCRLRNYKGPNSLSALTAVECTDSNLSHVRRGVPDAAHVAKQEPPRRPLLRRGFQVPSQVLENVL